MNPPPLEHNARLAAGRPVPEPSLAAQVALYIAGVVALVLLVIQIVGGDGHGVISGQGAPPGVKVGSTSG